MPKPVGVAYSITMRLEYPHAAGMLGRITSAIGLKGGVIGAIDMVDAGPKMTVRDLTVEARDGAHSKEIVAVVSAIPDVTVVHVSDQVFLKHLGGKIEVVSKSPVKTRNDLSLIYTPGVGRVSSAIKDDPLSAWNLTSKGNTVAIVTDGTAVLGLGDIGPAAALPVMEGKAVLFKELAGVNAWPVCLDTKDPDEIIESVKRIAPGFGGINLEDISAPRCFYIEDRLRAELDIPVFHDDQHGTAIVVLAALQNALMVVDKNISEIRLALLGVGAAGTAVARILIAAGVKDIIAIDRQGILHPGRDYGENDAKKRLAADTNPGNIKGGIEEALTGADVFIGVSGPDLVRPELIRNMASDAIVFAMATPDPEISPEDASKHARIVATGRSDYANQVNNCLCFPGLFRGVLDVRAGDVNDEMKLAAAKAIADGVPEYLLNEEYIIPGVFDRNVVDEVSRQVAEAARRTGVARKFTKLTGL